MRWFELLLVLSVAFGSSLFNAVSLLHHMPSPGPGLSSKWGFGLFHEVVCLCLLAYILHRRNARLRELGITWSLWDLLRTALVVIAAYTAYWLGGLIVYLLHHGIFGAYPVHVPAAQTIFGHPAGMAAIPFTLLNPFFEELIVRAFTISEIKALTGSATLAVAVSTLLQTGYHLYYGWFGALSLGFQFLFFSIYYARTRRATPVILAHGVFDLWSLVRLW